MLGRKRRNSGGFGFVDLVPYPELSVRLVLAAQADRFDQCYFVLADFAGRGIVEGDCRLSGIHIFLLLAHIVVGIVGIVFLRVGECKHFDFVGCWAARLGLFLPFPDIVGFALENRFVRMVEFFVVHLAARFLGKLACFVARGIAAGIVGTAFVLPGFLVDIVVRLQGLCPLVRLGLFRVAGLMGWCQNRVEGLGFVGVGEQSSAVGQTVGELTVEVGEQIDSLVVVGHYRRRHSVEGRRRRPEGPGL